MLIFESGVLLPTDVGIERHEKPVLWFSTAPYWEPSATKGFKSPDESPFLPPRNATIPEMAAAGQGLFRFGISTEQLVRWPDIGKRSGCRAEMRNILMKVGRAWGADPKQWYGTTSSIEIEHTRIESLSGFREWVGLDELLPTIEQAREFNIEVQAIDLDQLKELSLAAYRQKHGNNSTTDNPDFLARICVNYIRHELTTYDRYLDVIANNCPGKEAGLLVFQDRVYSAIAAAYPHLKDECTRQICHRFRL